MGFLMLAGMIGSIVGGGYIFKKDMEAMCLDNATQARYQGSSNERERIKRRQAEGIAIAKLKGKYKGRKRISIDMMLLRDCYEKWRRGELKKRSIAKKLGISMSTLERRLKQISINDRPQIWKKLLKYRI